MSNQNNAPLVIEFNHSIQLNDRVRSSDEFASSETSRDDTIVTDLFGNQLAIIPNNKVLNKKTGKKMHTLALNHICFEGVLDDHSLLFYRIDRDDLDALNAIIIPKQHIYKILVDGNPVWPTNDKASTPVHLS